MLAALTKIHVNLFRFHAKIINHGKTVTVSHVHPMDVLHQDTRWTWAHRTRADIFSTPISIIPQTVDIVVSVAEVFSPNFFKLSLCFSGEQVLVTLVTNKDVKGSISFSFYGLDSAGSDQTIFQT